MDLTTLAAAVLVVFGLLTADAVMHSGSVAVEVAAPARVTSTIIDQQSLEAAFTAQLDQIASTVSSSRPRRSAPATTRASAWCWPRRPI